jgi:hypothetical protein
VALLGALSFVITGAGDVSRVEVDHNASCLRVEDPGARDGEVTLKRTTLRSYSAGAVVMPAIPDLLRLAGGRVEQLGRLGLTAVLALVAVDEEHGGRREVAPVQTNPLTHSDGLPPDA